MGGRVLIASGFDPARINIDDIFTLFGECVCGCLCVYVCVCVWVCFFILFFAYGFNLMRINMDDNFPFYNL